MYVEFTCELCFKKYDSDDGFKICKGDACHEMCCGNCMKKCKDPTCNNYVCEECLRRNDKYSGEYCITCAMWDEDEDEEMVNFDYVAKGFTHDAGYEYLTAMIRKRERDGTGDGHERD